MSEGFITQAWGLSSNPKNPHEASCGSTSIIPVLLMGDRRSPQTNSPKDPVSNKVGELTPRWPCDFHMHTVPCVYTHECADTCRHISDTSTKSQNNNSKKREKKMSLKNDVSPGRSTTRQGRCVPKSSWVTHTGLDGKGEEFHVGWVGR